METSETLLNGGGKIVNENINKEQFNWSAVIKSLLILIIVFGISVMLLLYLYMKFPALNENEKQYLKIPWNMEDAKSLGKVLEQYKDLYYFEVMFGVFLVYIFLQTFAIPGSLFLSVLSGYLFSLTTAIILVCFCSALGASLCYLLSQVVGGTLIKLFCPDRARQMAEKIEKHKDNLFSYMLFLRMTPILPNWFINLVAPVVGVPLYPFALGTFIGVAPPSFFAVQAGVTLNTLNSSNEAFSWYSIALVSGLGILSLVPVIFKDYFKKKIE